MLVLGLESSCDETGVALFDSKQGLLAHNLYSQTEIHRDYGGVVPELASRDHIKKLLPMVDQTIRQARVTAGDIDGVAYTAGPGLVGALLVAAAVGRSLAWGWGVPAVAVHHMEGHLLAPMLEHPAPAFPFVALLVSGGHTLLVRVDGVGCYEILGESVDDAAGEAFDKTAKLLGLDYPGGPALAALANKGNADKYRFPRPMTNRPGLDFSFSGLKTFAMNTFLDSDQSDQAKADIAVAFQDAVVDTLLIKCRRAMQSTELKRLVIAGGVSANTQLREKLAGMVDEFEGELFFPRPAFCTDNGAMIAYAGYCRLQAGEAEPIAFNARSRWPIDTLSRVNR